MDARVKTIREILYAGDQYLVPFFQRSYSWERKHWERLREDLDALLESGTSAEHFLGPLVCTPAAHVPGDVPAYQLVDGQQRLATVTVLLAALRDVCRECKLENLASEIAEDYLVHRRKEGLQRYKVVPRLGDREVLVRLIERRMRPEDMTNGMFKAYRFYRGWVRRYVPGETEEQLRQVLGACTSRLSLVVITINEENPYQIFESLNSTGLPLEESDLIRNFVFMQIPLPKQEQFNLDQWLLFEGMFDPDRERPPIRTTPFYRNFLMRNGDYSKKRATYSDFKDQNHNRGQTAEEAVVELRHFAQFEVWFHRPELCDNPNIRTELSTIARLDIATAHPLLMHLLERHDKNSISERDLVDSLRDIQSFVIRRSICGESTRGYGRLFPTAIREMRDRPRSDLLRYWLSRGWPDDTTFIKMIRDFAIYRREPKKCRLVLEALERAKGHKERVDLSSLSIDHVMPQNVTRGRSAHAWQRMLGTDWGQVHARRLHTLGNLTLTGYNPELSDQPYREKREEFGDSNLALNAYFANVECWHEIAIVERGLALGRELTEIWPRPSGGPVYVPPAAPRARAEPPRDSDVVFVIHQVGVDARMRIQDGKHVVLAGSTARKDATRSWTGQGRREKLLRSGAIVDDGKFLRFVKDTPFRTISGAATQVLARQSNGNVDWRVEGTDMTFGDWLQFGPHEADDSGSREN